MPQIYQKNYVDICCHASCYFIVHPVMLHSYKVINTNTNGGTCHNHRTMPVCYPF